MSTSRLDCARPGMPGHGINASKPSAMKVESEHGDVAGLFTEIADIVDEYGGHLHPGLIIRNSGQSYCAAITPQGLAAAPEQPLIAIPRSLLIPVDGIGWQVRDGRLQAVSGLSDLSGPQRLLLERMLSLYNLAGKVEEACRTLPALALQGQEGLLELLRRGRRHWVGTPAPPAEAFIGTRTLAYSQYRSPPVGATARPVKVLMPLIDVLNHHPGGAPFAASVEGVSVAVRAKGEDLECFGSYGFRDALSLLLNYGFASTQPQFVQSIACEVDLAGWGRLGIQRQDFIPPRDLPRIDRTHDGVTISHLNLPADRSRHAADRLALALRMLRPGATGDAVEAAAREAGAQVHALNRAYYQQLSAAVDAAAGAGAQVLDMLRIVIDHQLQALQPA